MASRPGQLRNRGGRTTSLAKMTLKRGVGTLESELQRADLSHLLPLLQKQKIGTIELFATLTQSDLVDELKLNGEDRFAILSPLVASPASTSLTSCQDQGNRTSDPSQCSARKKAEGGRGRRRQR